MDENFELVRRIMLATNQVDGVYALLSKKQGTNANTLAFLYALIDRKLHSQKEISDEWLIPRTTINSIVKTMLAEGYIEFSGDMRGKEKALRLTKRGEAYTDKIFADIYEAEEQAIIGTLGQYSPEFVTALEDFAQRLHEEFQKQFKKGNT